MALYLFAGHSLIYLLPLPLPAVMHNKIRWICGGGFYFGCGWWGRCDNIILSFRQMFLFLCQPFSQAGIRNPQGLGRKLHTHTCTTSLSSRRKRCKGGKDRKKKKLLNLNTSVVTQRKSTKPASASLSRPFYGRLLKTINQQLTKLDFFFFFFCT